MSTLSPAQMQMTAKEYRAFMNLPSGSTIQLPKGVKAAEFVRTNGLVQPATSAPQIRMPRPRKMNQGEQEYQRFLIAEHQSCLVLFEPFTLHLPSGTRYTPDLVVLRGAEIVCLCEVKGPRIHNGHTLRAYKEAVSAFPMWTWRFAQKQTEGWAVKISQLCNDQTHTHAES